MIRPKFDPAAYPGQRPAGPVAVLRDRIVPLHISGSDGEPLLSAASGSKTDDSSPVLSAQELRYSVAYGSNASPERLMDKGLSGRGAVLLPAVVRGWAPAFEARRTSYGAVPLTFVPLKAALTHTWVLGLLPQDVVMLDRTEGRTAAAASPQAGLYPPDTQSAPEGAYRLGRVGDVQVAGRFRLRNALAYLPGIPTRVQRVGKGFRIWPDSDQKAASRHIDEGGEHVLAPPLGEIVTGAWPATHLERLAD